RKKAPRGPVGGRRGRRRRAARAGLRVRALKAERTTETAMVTANCWYMRPVMPGMKAVGTKTAARMRAMAATGPAASCRGWGGAQWVDGGEGGRGGGEAALDVVLDGFDDDDGVVDDEADGEDEAEEGEGVDGEAEEGEDGEGADEGDGDGEEGDEGGADALEE